MKIKWFTYIVLIYLLLASTWWTVLLFKKNESEYEVKKELYHITKERSLSELNNEYQRQKRMIIGECLFLGGTLLAGMWLIYRGHRKEVDSITQQNNFLLAITHELKSPLSSIDLIHQTLLSRKLDHSKQQTLIHTSRNELKRLEEMIDNLLISAKEGPSNQTIFEKHRITDLLFNIINQIQKEESQIRLSFTNKLDSDVYISCDPELISIAIKNIINNAVKYGKESKIEISLKQESSHMVLAIADQGIGISKKEKEKIFNKFYRVGDEMIRKQKGSGLGLYIAKRIVEKHNGKIRLKDNSPKGSIFIIELPCTND